MPSLVLAGIKVCGSIHRLGCTARICIIARCAVDKLLDFDRVALLAEPGRAAAALCSVKAGLNGSRVPADTQAGLQQMR
jgi:hypothetical protein